MNLSKYVEVYCKSIFFYENTPKSLVIEITSDFPTNQTTQNIQKKWLNKFSWLNNSAIPVGNSLVFANYVQNFLSLQFSLHLSSEAQATISFSKIFEIPLFEATTVSLYSDRKHVGYIELSIYIHPCFSRYSHIYNPVIVCPVSPMEIAVFYKGELTHSKEVYCIYTIDDWESNKLVKMKKWKKHWVLNIEKTNSTKQIELAFTDNDQKWDNQNGDNWIFVSTKWWEIN